MVKRDRWRALVLLVSVATLLVAPALAAAQDPANPATGPGATGGDYCIYLQGNKADTPETGPLPCDTSRVYMIGHSGFGSSDGDSSESDGASASPSTGNVDRSIDIEAP